MHAIHREHFFLICADELTEQGEFLADSVARRAHQVGGLTEGETFEFGWCVLKLVRSGDKLELQEPDYSANPLLNFRSDVSTSLRVVLAQNELLHRIQVVPRGSRFDEKIVLRKGCLPHEHLYMERSPPTDGDSGWYLSQAGEQSSPEASDLESIYSFQLLAARPSLLSCLLLPPGWFVVWQGNKIEAVVNADDQKVYPQVE